MAKHPKPELKYLEMVRTPGGLKPATAYDDDILSRYKLGTRIIVTIEAPRDEKLNRFYFALVNKVARAKGIDPDLLHWRLKLACGKVKKLIIGDEVHMVPPSISEMDQATFSEYVDAAVTEITTAPGLLPGAAVKDIMNETVKYVGGLPL